MSSSDIPNASQDVPSLDYSRIRSRSIMDKEMTIVGNESGAIIS